MSSLASIPFPAVACLAAFRAAPLQRLPHMQQQEQQQRRRAPRQQQLAAQQQQRRRAMAAAAAAAGPAEGVPRGPVVVVDNYDSFTYNLCQVSIQEVCPALPAAPAVGAALPLAGACSATVTSRLPFWPPALPLQYLGDLGCEYVVFPNDEKTVEEIAAMNPRGILVSPGPGG